MGIDRAVTLKGVFSRLGVDDGRIRFDDEDWGPVDDAGARQILNARLYGRLHAGMAVSEEAEPLLPSPDTELEDAILEATPEKWRVEAAPFLQEHPTGLGCFVARDGIITFVPEERLESRRGLVVKFRTKCSSRRLSTGFVFHTSPVPNSAQGDILRIYRRGDSPEETVDAWHELVRHGAQKGFAYRAKVLARSTEYPRNDAVVVYLPSVSWGHVGTICDLLRTSEENASPSEFALTVRPGVSVAWEPQDPRGRGRLRSFGEHRCALVADSFLSAYHAGRDATPYAAARFQAANADPVLPHRNLDSPRVDVPALGGGVVAA